MESEGLDREAPARPRDLLALELDQVREDLANFAVSSVGQARCRGLAPRIDPQVVGAELQRAWECLRLLERAGTPPFGEIPDVRESLRSAAHEGFVLDGAALVQCRAVLDAATAVGAFLRKHAGEVPSLAALPDRLASLPNVASTLHRALDDQGQVTDDASEELAEVRRSLRSLRDKLTRRLDDLVNRSSMAEVLSDRFVTVRNNRFVVPVRSAAAPRFDGVVQDRSISGETLFIEPLFAVAWNNRLLLAAKEEEALVRRILADLTALVRGQLATLATTFEALIEIDVLMARARYARRYRCTQPRLTRDEIDLRAARHPLLARSGHDVVPVEIQLPRGKNVLVITGPNTGGKTVALKTVGLLALMAQSGMLLPVEEGSGLPCFAAIYADVGDAQSIERNLSTFSAHVDNLKEILAGDVAPQLVLLDEPGVGTDPEEGAALGVGLIEVLARRGAWVVVSTHYAAIKTYALGSDACVTAAVDFDLEALAARYRLVYHSVGESLALPIARRLGLPEPVLQAAQAARGEREQAFAVAMARLEQTRRDYEARLAEIEARSEATIAAAAEAKRLRDELRQRKRERWSQELAEAREVVRKVREQGREMLAAIEARTVDRHRLQRWVQERQGEIRREEEVQAEPLPRPAPPPRLGDEVGVEDSSIRGTLLSVEGERTWVQRGSMRFEVPKSALRKLGGKEAPSIEVRVEKAEEERPAEISLLGLRVKEALERLESFLDQATRAGHGGVRVIHGIGSGALRRAVAEYLSGSRYCAGFRIGEAGEGGAGVTIVELNN